jgi:hypothetical protein
MSRSCFRVWSKSDWLGTVTPSTDNIPPGFSLAILFLAILTCNQYYLNKCVHLWCVRCWNSTTFLVFRFPSWFCCKIFLSQLEDVSALEEAWISSNSRQSKQGLTRPREQDAAKIRRATRISIFARTSIYINCARRKVNHSDMNVEYEIK